MSTRRSYPSTPYPVNGLSQPWPARASANPCASPIPVPMPPACAAGCPPPANGRDDAMPTAPVGRRPAEVRRPAAVAATPCRARGLPKVVTSQLLPGRRPQVQRTGLGHPRRRIAAGGLIRAGHRHRGLKRTRSARQHQGLAQSGVALAAFRAPCQLETGRLSKTALCASTARSRPSR